jgi:hypothetical protein
MKFKSAIKVIATVVLPLVFTVLLSPGCSSGTQDTGDFYEIRVYHISGLAQETLSDSFFRDVFLPALHRAGISKVGVFKPIESDSMAFGKLIYLFIPFNSSDQYIGLNDILAADKVYNEKGKFFLDAPFDDPPFNRYESILLKAFRNMPHFNTPEFVTPPGERIYELRSYESATESKGIKKIEMFNDAGEIELFMKLDFNPVFYGQVIAGSHKPNLMYMTTFQDMDSHDQHWKDFVGSDEWKTMSGLEEYKNTVSRADVSLLHPESYSDF